MDKLEVFIEKTNTVHGNRYDYSNVKYIKIWNCGLFKYVWKKEG